MPIHPKLKMTKPPKAMKDKHTPFPWKTGRTLVTATTKNWSQDEINRNDEKENRMVFSQFSGIDQGRARVLVCICERKEDAEKICELAQAPTLLEQNRELKELLRDAKVQIEYLHEKFVKTGGTGTGNALLLRIDTALNKTQ